MFHLRTFGGLTLQRDGKSLDQVNAQRKALALLAVLAAAGAEGFGREKLMLLLWSESDAGRARGALKQMLHSLRRQLGAPGAIVGTTEIRLDPCCVASDVGGFRAALAGGDLEAAVALYHGPFLDGVHLDGAPEFERWAEAERVELARQYAAALGRLARDAESRGEPEEAAAWWQRLQVEDPLSGRVVLALMAALEGAGDRTAALRHAEAHEMLLREEWGLAPDPAVTALAERLREPAGPTQPRRSAAAAGTSSPVAAVEALAPLPAGTRTPESRAEGKGAAIRDRRLPRPTWPALAALLLLGAALVGIVGVRGVPASSFPGGGAARTGPAVEGLQPAEQGSIAVLSFLDMSPERDQEYFSDGITEELITHLSKVQGLKVAARTSSFQFKGRPMNSREVGVRLGVAHVLEGSVRKAGDRLRITVQLTSAENGYHVWAETYERGLSDVFAVQEEISRAVVDALRLHLTENGGVARARRATQSVEAYELYLRGRFFTNQRTEGALDRAAEYFQQALAIDPRFARAYAGLADSYIAPRSSAPGERFRRAGELAARALELDSTLAEAHTALGWIEMWYGRDWAAAERHLQRAIALDPDYLWAHQWHSAYLAAVGRLEEALEVKRRALPLDPLSVSFTTHIGTDLFWLGRYEEAIHQYRKALELDPGFFMAHWGLSRAYLQLGRHEEALRELQYPGSDYLGFSRPALLGYAHAVAGREAEARRILAELRTRRDAGEYVAPTAFATIHIGLGEKDRALDWLERHEADRGARIFLKVDPIFDPLRTEPRFQRLLRRLGLE
jgi:adenylate cyclase